MGQMKLTPLSEVIDEVWGKKGTPKRDAMEAELRAEVNTKSTQPSEEPKYQEWDYRTTPLAPRA